MVRDHAGDEVDVGISSEGDVHAVMHLSIDAVKRHAGRTAVAARNVGAVFAMSTAFTVALVVHLPMHLSMHRALCLPVHLTMHLAMHVMTLHLTLH